MGEAVSEASELIRLTTWAGFDQCFSLFSQPVINLDDPRAKCGELLLRCVHSPSITNLIEAYEQAGLSSIIDKWVAQQAVNLLADNPQITHYSINVSPFTLRDPSFATTLIKMAGRAGVNPARLKLELVERYLLAWSADADSSLLKLRQQGFEFWLDDFGMGHSLSDIADRVRPEAIKMDGVYIRRLGEARYRRVVEHVIAIASEFGSLSIAEGVDSEDILNLVKSLGFNMAQGFHLGKPEPVSLD